MTRHHKTRSLPVFDRPLRRLAWVVPVSLCMWTLLLAGFSILLGRTSPPPPLQPLEVSLADLSQGLAGGSPGGGGTHLGGEASGAKSPSGAPLTLPHPLVAAEVAHLPARHHLGALEPSISLAPKTRPKIGANKTKKTAAERVRQQRLNDEEDTGDDEETTVETAAVNFKPRQAASPSPAIPSAQPVGGVHTNVEDVANHGEGLGGKDGGHGNGSGNATGNGSGGQGTGTGGGIGEGSQLYTTVEHPPVPVSRVLPEYPSAARSRGLEGEVVLRAIVDRRGAVEPNVVVVESIPLLDQAAIEALRQWRFQPGRDAYDRPVRVIIEVPLRFQLR